MIKQPPYDVTFCEAGEAPPPYVRYISSASLKLGGSLEQLNALGYETEIPISASTPEEENELVLNLMLKLHKHGFAFSYDFKVTVSPSSYMMELLENDVLTTSFNEISWSGKDRWKLTKFEYQPST
ncbi:hypothetical protein A1QK_14420 [Vibrio genomosp. F10 str. 9ZD137]|nr:hypothetical protein A1QK_14420 [Vibrio genomosp. F10 str. 9ZD137]